MEKAPLLKGGGTGRNNGGYTTVDLSGVKERQGGGPRAKERCWW